MVVSYGFHDWSGVQVPGIGPAAAKNLASGDDPNERITNTFQLIGECKGPPPHR